MKTFKRNKKLIAGSGILTCFLSILFIACNAETTQSTKTGPRDIREKKTSMKISDNLVKDVIVVEDSNTNEKTFGPPN